MVLPSLSGDSIQIVKDLYTENYFTNYFKTIHECVSLCMNIKKRNSEKWIFKVHSLFNLLAYTTNTGCIVFTYIYFHPVVLLYTESAEWIS